MINNIHGIAFVVFAIWDLGFGIWDLGFVFRVGSRDSVRYSKNKNSLRGLSGIQKVHFTVRLCTVI